MGGIRRAGGVLSRIRKNLCLGRGSRIKEGREKGGRTHGNATQPGGSAPELGGSETLAGILRYLLEADFFGCAEVWSNGVGSPGGGAGDGHHRGQESWTTEIRSGAWFVQRLVAPHHSLAHRRSVSEASAW